MKHTIYQQAHDSLSLLEKQVPITEETNDAINKIQTALYDYASALHTINGIEAKIYHFTENRKEATK